MAARPEVTGRRSGPPAGEVIERYAFTIDEFCKTHRVSPSAFYEMQRRGEGPEINDAAGRHIITVESAARWRERSRNK
jgi:hypothetical protein